VQIVMSNRANTDRVLPIDGFRQSLKSLLPLMAVVLAAVVSLQCSSGGTAAPPDSGAGGSGGGGGGGSSTVDAPTFSPAAGSYSSAQSVSITTTTSGATICYRTDGVDPTAPTAGTCGAGSTTYSSAINISSTTTLKALGTKSGMTNSSVTSGTYTIDTTAPTPGTNISFSGTTDTQTTVSWGAGSDDVTATAQLQYRLLRSNTSNLTSVADAESNGTEVMPYTTNTTSQTVTGLTASTTYYFAVIVRDQAGNKALYSQQSVTTSAAGSVAAPTFSPTPGTFNSAQNVTITTSTSGATICYRTDGVDPTAPTAGTCGAGSTTYSSAVPISATTTLKALATKSGMTNSSVTSGVYTIDTTPPTVSSTNPANSATGIAKNTTVAATFSEAMNTSTITTTTTTSCTGSLQVSADNFSTCVAMTSVTPTATMGNTVFTMTPASALSSATTYKIRVTNAAQDVAGNALTSTFTTSTGFTVRYYHTITIDGSYDYIAADEQFAASDSKNVQVAWDENYIYIGYTNEAFNVTNKAIYVAIDSDPVASPPSRALPFQAYYEGSTTTVPFEADYLYFVKFNGGGEKYRCVYSGGAWQTRESNPTGFSEYMQDTGMGNATELAIPRNQIGNPNKVAITVYAKDLTNNSGWGWMFGVLGETTFSQGTGDKTITKYYEFDLNGSTKPTAHTIKP